MSEPAVGQIAELSPRLGRPVEEVGLGEVLVVVAPAHEDVGGVDLDGAVTPHLLGQGGALFEGAVLE